MVSKLSSKAYVAMTGGDRNKLGKRTAWHRDMAIGLIALGDAIDRAGANPDVLAIYDIVSRIFARDSE
jgi:hypothetical protein